MRDSVAVADFVHTPALLNQMLDEKPLCWPWAAFTSVVFQRWYAVDHRLFNQLMRAPAQPTGWLNSGPEVARFVTNHVRAVDDACAEAEVLLRSPALAEAFGRARDGSMADGEAIVRAAHRVADHFERVLRLAEECRNHGVLQQYADLLEDCIRFANRHLRDFNDFASEALERLQKQQKRAIAGRPLLAYKPIPLQFGTEAELIFSILDRLQALE